MNVILASAMLCVLAAPAPASDLKMTSQIESLSFCRNEEGLRWGWVKVRTILRNSGATTHVALRVFRDINTAIRDAQGEIIDGARPSELDSLLAAKAVDPLRESSKDFYFVIPAHGVSASHVRYLFLPLAKAQGRDVTVAATFDFWPLDRHAIGTYQKVWKARKMELFTGEMTTEFSIRVPSETETFYYKCSPSWMVR